MKQDMTSISSAQAQPEIKRATVVRGLVVSLIINATLPFIIYLVLTTYTHLPSLTVLLATGIPPVLHSLVGVILHRRVDFIAGIALASIVVSLVVILLLGGDERLYLIRESFFTAAIGLALLIALLFPRPLTFYLARTLMVGNTQQGIQQFEAKWQQSAGFRAGLRKSSLVWGLGLLVEAGARICLVFVLNTTQFLAISPFITYGIIGLLIIWSVYEARH